MTANKDVIKGNWKIVKGKVMKQWGKLTDNDFTQAEGSYEELKGLLQKRYGFSQDKAKMELDNFIKTLKLDQNISSEANITERQQENFGHSKKRGKAA